MKVAIVGAGPAGVMAGIKIAESDQEVTFFDLRSPLSTLLPTGGGRCNLAYAEFDNSELIRFYPRGGKFLLSVFSRFSTGDTLEFFENIGVKTYVQDDLRIFPISNSAKDVREKLLKKLKKDNVVFVKGCVTDIKKIDNKFKLFTDNIEYTFDKVIFAGGIKNNSQLLKNFGISIVDPKPALCALCVEEESLYNLSGVTLKNIQAQLPGKIEVLGDMLFTHNSLSGPLAYKISSLCAYEKFPYLIKLNLVGTNREEFEQSFIKELEKNAKKDLVNIVSIFVPRSFAQYVLKKNAISETLKANQLNKKQRGVIVNMLTNYVLKITSQKPCGEIVTAGGVDLNFINAKTMEYKGISGLYFCGEVLNIDGFTGGFNLQNCWSTGYIAGVAVANDKKL